MEAVGKLFDHMASFVIVVQWIAPGVGLVWAFKKRHPIIRHGKRVLRQKEDE